MKEKKKRKPAKANVAATWRHERRRKPARSVSTGVKMQSAGQNIERQWAEIWAA